MLKAFVLFYFDMKFCYVAQASIKLQSSSDPLLLSRY